MSAVRASRNLGGLAFIFGIGYGYFQYRVFCDIIAQRSNKLSQANEDILNILNNKLIIRKLEPKVNEKYENMGWLFLKLYEQKAMTKVLNVVGKHLCAYPLNLQR
eukprot:TRINITY_DN2976_c0_g1_i2.p1 TRINITY_DN2976_c0_g1~~TRINITY_DN2976_c0_g1_i2.p1  ORF type:complete len:105 (-),score=24.03 TRINITY_DN2976_c0_g1_i2:103-417(-)